MRTMEIRRIICVAAVVLMLAGCTSSCAGLKEYTKSGQLSAQIQYYDSYVEGAAKWLSYAALLPGIGPYAATLGLALGAVDGALDNFKAMADQYAVGSAVDAQIDVAAATLKRAITDYNAVVGSLPPPLRPVQ